MDTAVDEKSLIALTQALLREPSVTPLPEKSLDIIEDFCHQLGLFCRRMDCGETANLFVTSHQEKQFSLLFCGHVDVVPPGDLSLWSDDPFSGKIVGDYLYGRGAVDMKSSIAAFLIALQRSRLPTSNQNKHSDSVAMIFTSDEEGLALDGTKYVIKILMQEGYEFTCGLVGEPTSELLIGDTIKVGRRGSLSGKITVTGRQSHVAYAHADVNPIFSLASFVHHARSYTWDQGHAMFSKTAFCPTQFQSHSDASNVTPSTASCCINFRFCPASSIDSLKKQVHDLLDAQGLEYAIEWLPSSKPFYVSPGDFSKSIVNLMRERYAQECQLSTGGGTSDARFIAPYVDELVELGPLNATAHQIDERISIHDLKKICDIYADILDFSPA